MKKFLLKYLVWVLAFSTLIFSATYNINPNAFEYDSNRVISASSSHIIIELTTDTLAWAILDTALDCSTQITSELVRLRWSPEEDTINLRNPDGDDEYPATIADILTKHGCNRFWVQIRLDTTAAHGRASITGTCTDTSDALLIDTNATFQTDIVGVDYIVTNTSIDSSSTIASVDTEDTLTTAAMIFTDTSQTYSITANYGDLGQQVNATQCDSVGIGDITLFGYETKDDYTNGYAVVLADSSHIFSSSGSSSHTLYNYWKHENLSDDVIASRINRWWTFPVRVIPGYGMVIQVDASDTVMEKVVVFIRIVGVRV